MALRVANSKRTAVRGVALGMRMQYIIITTVFRSTKRWRHEGTAAEERFTTPLEVPPACFRSLDFRTKFHSQFK